MPKGNYSVLISDQKENLGDLGYIIILIYELYVQNVQYMQGVDSSPVDILRGASVEGSIWP